MLVGSRRAATTLALLCDLFLVLQADRVLMRVKWSDKVGRVKMVGGPGCPTNLEDSRHSTTPPLDLRPGFQTI